MNDVKQLKHFRFWCQKVLPLVYEDSLSYYEVLCKVVKYLNNLMDDVNAVIEDMDALREEMAWIREKIENFDTKYIEEIVKDYLATMIFVGISDSGYIVYYIPEHWDDIIFNTTGLDVDLPEHEYGRLVLSY